MVADLKPQPDPIQLDIDYKMVVLGMIIFAIIFWTIGTTFRYYVYVGGSV